jgi:maspardin
MAGVDLLSRYRAFCLAHPRPRERLVGGVVWRWYEAGAGEPALVVLPGAVGGGQIFFLLLQELSPARRVLTVDLPFVKSGESALAGLDALLESEGIHHAILLGASFSGLLVQAFASRFPARTAGIVLSHTGALNSARATQEHRNAARVRRLPFPLTRALLRVAVRLLLRRAGEGRRLWTDLYDVALAETSREALASRYELAASLDALEVTNGAPWGGPILIIHSDNDEVARPAERERLKASYPRAEWRVFPGTGHSTYSIAPVEYAAVIGLCADAVQRGDRRS